MPFSFPKFSFKRTKRHLQTDSINPNISSSSASSSESIVGSNGWLACKEAMKTLKDMAPGPLAPLQIALVAVLAFMEHAERVSGSQDDFLKLAHSILTFKDIFLPYQGRANLSPNIRGHLDHVLMEINDINTALLKKTERGLVERTFKAFKDVNEIGDIVEKLDRILRDFKIRCDLEMHIGINTLAMNDIFSKLRHVPAAGIDALDEAGCMDGTRVELLQNLQKWAQDPTECSIFWLDGMAGTGKSAISQSLSRFLQDNHLLAGSFFCRRGHESRSDVKRILPTLAWFLARRDQNYRESLLQSLQSEPDLADSSIEKQSRYLLEEPLSHVLNGIEAVEMMRTPLVFVIDALDECAEEGVKQLLNKLLSLPGCLPIKFFLTSRPERHIRNQFESQQSKLHQVLRLHDIEKYIVDADISLYFQAQLKRIRSSNTEDFPEKWPSLRSVERLTALSGKLFIYAFTAIKYIEHHDPIGRLEKLTGTASKLGPTFNENLDEMYSLVLSVAMDPKKFDESEILETKRILAAVLVIREPLSLSVLAALLDIPPSSVRTNVDQLQAVISVPPQNDGVVSTFHASFGDYLTTPGRAPENILLLLTVGHRDLANSCLQIMAKDLKFNITGSKSSHLRNTEQRHRPISLSLKYSCVHWAHHVVDATELESLLETVKTVLFSKFLYWLEVLSMMKASTLAPIFLMQILTADGVKRKMASDLIRFCEDAHEFVTLFHVPISTSAPHIYISALPLVRKDSMILTLFGSMFQNTVKVTLHGIDKRRKVILDLRGHDSWVTSVCFSPDGMRIVSGSDDNTIRVWNAETGEEAMKPFSGHSDCVKCVSFSPNGAHIVSGSADNTIRVWDTRTGDEIMSPLNGHTHWVNSVSFSPDGSCIVSGSSDNTIRIWNAGTGQQMMQPLKSHTKAVYSVCFSPDGTHIISGSCDNTIRMWNVRSGEEVMKPLNGHTDRVRSVAFSPDGTHIVSGSSDKTIRIWSAKTGDEIMKPLRGHTHQVNCVSFSPDGSNIVSGSYDKTIRIWDVSTGELIMQPLNIHIARVNSVCFSPDGKHIVSGSTDKTIRVWEKRREDGVKPLGAYVAKINSVRFSPDGRCIVSGSDKITMWDAMSGKEIVMPFNGHTREISSASFSPDGTRIVSGSSDNTIQLWDAKTGQVHRSLNGHTNEVKSVCFSPNGTHIVSGSSDNTIRVWDASTGKEVLKPLCGHTDDVKCVRFSPDGMRIVSGSSDTTIRVWDVESGEEATEPLKGHAGHVKSVCFSPDGLHIVSGSSDKTIRVWDVTTGKLVMPPLHRHTNGVNSVCFSPDGKHIVSGSSDKTIRVWDAITGEQVVQPFNMHLARVNSVCFSPDGNRIISGSSDNTIRVWDVGELSDVNSDTQQSPTISSLSPSILGAGNLNPNGWIVGPAGRLILWVLREGLVLHPCQLVIGPSQVFVDVRRFVQGTEWTSVYTPEIE